MSVSIHKTATSSTAVRFVDTDVLLYAISRDPEEQGKAERANDILASRDLALSEDLGDGEDYAGVRVENPFRGS